ncbi:hypothetical protein [Planobispora longispora]|uniref:Uncharacterized protein n=1 Tax=Planobispora longispora TaxID=28887 RepID=A0A8J3RJK7_9ACTN|nr:hypothetical protein [Planobispora longispora]BFE85829.1 hypothetical protein GCM10020093_084300 [Planobispora longispora]GIH76139.1 hypothetical protein Plo01_25680 [Planobispora longispora]
MAPTVLLDAYAYVAGHDFTTETNRLSWSGEAAALDRTTFGSGGWTELTGGLKSHTFDMAGFWDSAAADAVDPEAFTDLGGGGRVFTFGPIETEGEVAYLGQLGHFNYSLLGAHGELAPFSLTSQGTDGVGIVRGKLAKAKGAAAATGVLGSVVELGNVPAGQYLYASLHVISAGTTITVQLQSDDSAGFASPTTRATIGPITTRGGTWATRVAGPLTETHYRLNVSAITGAHVVAGAIAIGK